MVDTPGQTCERVEQVLEQQIAQVRTPEAAEAVVRHAEALTAGDTAEERARTTAVTPRSAASAVELAAQTAPPAERVAAVLTTTAAEAAAETPEAPAVQEAALAALGSGSAPPGTERGRELLREAVLRRMNPLDHLDARLFLLVNSAPHPSWLDAAVDNVTVITRGGWVWAIGVAIAGVLGTREARRALALLLPSLLSTTAVVEYPVKSYFRRRRPFIDVVQALVVGRRPGGWSFPSGHTASSFTAALVLSTLWPRLSPLFFGLASCVGVSRVYAGAHYPSDVSFGALFGVSLAALVRRLIGQWLNR